MGGAEGNMSKTAFLMRESVREVACVLSLASLSVQQPKRNMFIVRQRKYANHHYSSGGMRSL